VKLTKWLQATRPRSVDGLLPARVPRSRSA
jgi:hypothetical protein